jgi:serine/threonine protein kinase
MIFEQPEPLRQRIVEVAKRSVNGKIEVFEDTSPFMSIEPGSVIRLAGNDYFVMGHAREGRFGLDEQPKFWVKSTIDLTTGERKIIKLMFHETFDSRVGSTVFCCTRSPEKESAILSKMRGHPHFMQGESVLDPAGNLVRIIDFVPGPSLYDHLRKLPMPHATYYHEVLPNLMQSLIGCMGAISQLHRHGLHHGDIRADHIILKNRSDAFVWIDFDYEISQPNYDLFCLGNVLNQVVGKGRHSSHDIRLRPAEYPDFHGSLTLDDMSQMFQHRVANLRKLFPCISADLNAILMRFSFGSSDPYRDVDTLVADLLSVSCAGRL